MTKSLILPAMPSTDPLETDTPLSDGNSDVAATDVTTPAMSKKKEAPSSRTRFLVGGSGAEMPSYYNYVFAQRRTERRH